MGAKKHTLYSQCCKVVIDEESGRCERCGQWEAEPIPEPELLKDQDIEFLN
jgi:predicted ATP-dependent serine protease